MIKILDDNTIQKIAAGEVIERPASIVKELFENSIDAKAKNIQVEILDGGKSLISVADDGVGIASDQVETAFKRHATSKINDFEDLYNIYTMGFRGEALASIIAVGEVDIMTKSIDEDLGSHVLFKESKINQRSQIAMNTGTIISVKDLFSNIPVRKKFLKSSSAEANKITDILSKLSLGNPDLSVKYTKDNRIVYNVNDVDNQEERVRKIFSNDFADSLIEISGQSDNFTVQGFISNNTYFRGNRALQYFYINNRYVELLNLSKIIESSYTHIIPNGKFPAFQIYISTSPENIDVNIHPNKIKVNIRHIEELSNLIKDLVKSKLSRQNLSEINIKSKDSPNQKLFLDLDDKYKDLLNKTNDSNERNLVFEEVERIVNTDRIDVKDEDFEDDIEIINISIDNLFDDNEERSLDLNSSMTSDKVKIENDSNYADESNKNKNLDEANLSDYNIISNLDDYIYKAFIFKTYIIFENPKMERILVLDQHAAHERINFEELYTYYESDNKYNQELLIGLNIELLPSERDLIKDNYELFENFGYSFKFKENGDLSINEVPALDYIDHKLLFTDLVNSLVEYGDFNSPYLLEKVMQKACKNSIKANDEISVDEAMVLLKDLFECKYPLTCPHGRPTYIKLDKRSLDKEFSRIK